MKTTLILVFMLGFMFQAAGFQKNVASNDKVLPAKQDPQDTSAYFVTAENMPEPIGGIMAIQKKIVYPEIAKRAGIQGTVYVVAFIDEKGNVVQTGITKGVHPALDKAAQDAVANVKFKPGMQMEKAIRVRLAVPIRFRLSPESKAQKHSLYPGNYQMSGGGIEVPANAEWRAINTAIEEDKVLLVLQDKWKDQSGFWSVMSYLTKEEAKKLAEELRKAAEKIK
jgi:TonB family protein